MACYVIPLFLIFFFHTKIRSFYTTTTTVSEKAMAGIREREANLLRKETDVPVDLKGVSLAAYKHMWNDYTTKSISGQKLRWIETKDEAMKKITEAASRRNTNSEEAGKQSIRMPQLLASTSSSYDKTSEIEYRIDPSDNQPYSKQQFLEYYGGLVEWDSAAIAT